MIGENILNNIQNENYNFQEHFPNSNFQCIFQAEMENEMIYMIYHMNFNHVKCIFSHIHHVYILQYINRKNVYINILKLYDLP